MNYEEVFTFENLYKSHLKSRLSKRDKREVIEFEMNLGSNLMKLFYELKTNKYKITGYNTFYIYEPKERKVDALNYRDRIVQHCLCDYYLTSFLEHRLIYDNAATRIGKGTDFARRRLKHFYYDYFNKFKNNDGYVLKCDIHHFFESIDHNKLKEVLKKDISDNNILKLLFKIINSYEYENDKGLPIGNQTSQAFAIRYLDEMDRVIKEKYRIKYYIRYMDDFILVHKSKEYLVKVLDAIKEVIGKYDLELNSKTRIYKLKESVEFLGFSYRLYDNGKITMKLNAVRRCRFKNNVNVKIQGFKNNRLEFKSLDQSVQSYCGHIRKSSNNYVCTFINYINKKLSNKT